MTFQRSDLSDKKTYLKKLKAELKGVRRGAFEVLANHTWENGSKGTILLVHKIRVDKDLVTELKRDGRRSAAKGIFVLEKGNYLFEPAAGDVDPTLLETLGLPKGKVFVSKAEETGLVVNLDPRDETIDTASESISRNRKLGKDGPLVGKGEQYAHRDRSHQNVWEDKELEGSFTRRGMSAPIVLLAHGQPLGKSGSGKVHATHFARKKPAEIVTYLSKTLSKNYGGVIYLDGCFTGAGNTPLNFAEQVYKGLVKRGYRYLQVKGNLGLAATVDGKELVTPAELEDVLKDLQEEKKGLERDIRANQLTYTREKDPYMDQVDELALRVQATEKALKKDRATLDQLQVDLLTAQEGPEEEGRKIQEKITALTRQIQEAETRIRDDRKARTDVDAILDSIALLAENDPDRLRMRKRLAVVQAYLDRNLKIEELVGTWGPEEATAQMED